MVDEKTRTVWFTAIGREKGQDPYFRHLYRIGLDGKGLRLADAGRRRPRRRSCRPLARFIVDTYSTCETPPVVVLRDGEGKLVMPLEKADISKLLATGWKPPMPIIVKARDGKTDLYGMMFRPTNLDPTKKYPIINNAYPGPQSGSVGARTFAAARGDKQALAELGFVVVSIDGMGTPGRSKSFHDAYYGAMGRDNTLPDQVAGMKELAQQYPWIDIDRAAMWGHSGGGFIAADAMFRYPDFFKVGISESGNHDQRAYEDDWGERYQGLLTKTADGTDNYEVEANQTVAKNLKGKLLLAHGTDGQQRAAVQHAARRRRADQGEQGLRPAAVPVPGARVRRRLELHDAPAVGLLRAAGCSASSRRRSSSSRPRPRQARRGDAASGYSRGQGSA